MKRDYVVILASTLISSIFNVMLYPILSIYAKNAGGGYVFSGLIFALPLIITVVMYFAWGAISDYIGNRKLPFIIGGLIGSLFFFIYPFLPILPLIFARSVQAIFSAAGILGTAIVTEYYPEDKGKSIGLLNVAGGIGGTVGGLLMGFVISSSSIMEHAGRLEIFFFIVGVVNIVSVLIMLPIKEVCKKRAKGSHLLRFENRRPIALICATALVLALGTQMLFGIFPAYLAKQYDVDTVIIGLFMASASGFGILSSYYSGVFCDKYGRKRIFIGAAFVYVVTMFVYAYAPNLYVLLVVWSIPIWGFFWISGNSMVSDLTKENERGRGLGLLNSLSLGIGGFAGCVLGGLILDHLGFTKLCLIAALITGIATCLALTVAETKKPGKKMPCETTLPITVHGRTRY